MTAADVFHHEAMHTCFSLHLPGLTPADASALARHAFERIDQLEFRLSRYAEGGDVWRINQLQAGETLYLSEDCHRCLLAALDAHAQTAGLFDVTLGRQIDHAKLAQPSPAPVPCGQLEIHPDVPAVTCHSPGRIIDLGGIGKGFTLDALRSVLELWEIDDALVGAGASSWLAIGPRSWPIELCGDFQRHRSPLQNQALSASGISMQGRHIVHPTAAPTPSSSACTRLWVQAHDATTAEIWSTALMLVAPDALASHAASAPAIIALHAEIDGKLVTLKGALEPPADGNFPLCQAPDRR